MSRSSSKVTSTIELPGPEIDRSSLMPLTVFTTSSMGRDTCDSTSAGEAPGRTVLIRTVGRSTDGNRSTPSRT
jgi:hypothetical protein